MISIRDTIGALKVALFEDGGVEEIFRHARNLVVATLITTAGLYAVKNAAWIKLEGIVYASFAGYAVAALGVFLFCLNFAEGLYKLSKVRRQLFLQLVVVAIYVFITLRVAQLVIALRMQ